MPDLTGFALHKVIDDIDFEGAPVPGLSGRFYRREEGELTASVGVYSFNGVEVFRAWGYVGETHCRASALVRADGGWDGPFENCPEVRVHRRGRQVIGFSVRVGELEPVYIRLPPAEVPPHTRADGSVDTAGLQGSDESRSLVRTGVTP